MKFSKSLAIVSVIAGVALFVSAPVLWDLVFTLLHDKIPSSANPTGLGVSCVMGGLAQAAMGWVLIGAPFIEGIES